MEFDKSNQSTHSGEDRFAVFKEINQLRNLAQKQILKNQQLYTYLIQNGIPIDIQLYTRSVSNNKNIKDNQIQVQKRRLIALNDLVLSQASQLAKLQNRYTHKIQQSKNEKLQMFQQTQNMFMFMRKQWTHKFEESDISNQSQLDNLNKIIVSLKNNSQRILRQERKKGKNNSKSHIEQLIYNKEYQSLKQKYQGLLMVNEDKEIKNKKEIEIFQQRIMHLQMQNQRLKNEGHDNREKIKKLQNLLIKNQLKLQQITQKFNKQSYENQKIQKKTKIIFKNQNYQINIITSFTQDQKYIYQTHKSLDQIKGFLLHQNQIFINHDLIHKNIPQTNQPKQIKDTALYQNDQQVRPRKPSRPNNSDGNIINTFTRTGLVPIKSLKIQQINHVKFTRTNPNLKSNHSYIRRKKQEDNILNVSELQQ